MNSRNNLYTDLAYDIDFDNNKEEKIELKIVRNKHYTTIIYDDLNDYKKIENTIIKELKKYIKNKKNQKVLVVGLGNINIIPDSLGPKTIDKILITGSINSIDDCNVSCFIPGVVGNTGVETANIIKALVKEINATKLIVIDSLKTNNFSHLLKTIQITDKGITPGSGINSNRKEITKNKIGCDVIAIGIPTVIDIRTITNDNLKNYMLTPTNIEYLIDSLSSLLANSINKLLHKNLIRQKK